MTDINHLCPGCMREIKQSIKNGQEHTAQEKADREKCPYCGFSMADHMQNPQCLPIHTILAGKYLVGKVLGQGGFGITYMGYDLNMETRVAIKEYFPVELVSRDTASMTGDRVLSLSGDKSITYQQGLKKYVAEAQNVSRFSETPGVVSVKDFFYENETAYIVMEYIEGRSLKDYLKEKGGRLTEKESLEILKPVIQALIQVHKSGIIHRDLSLDNIMLTFDAEKKIKDIKLIDFGAARMTAKNDQKSLTIILKHGYAPEEQYRTHGEQGPWTDVYAICAVLYRMLSGETPVPAMDRMFQDSLKSLKELRVPVSESTEKAILAGLAVKRENRIPSMEELYRILYENAALKAKRDKSRNKKSYKAAAIVASVVFIAAVGAMALSGRGVKKEKPGELPNVMSEAAEAASAAIDETSMEPEGTETVHTAPEKEQLGETIVSYTPQRSVSSASNSHSIFCLPDGTAAARGENQNGQCSVEEWTHLAAVTAAGNCSYGLRTDGTVLYAGNENLGMSAVRLWTDIVDIQASGSCVLGLKTNGTVAAAGVEIDSVKKIIDDVRIWSGIKAITLDGSTAVGLTQDGTLLFAGEIPDNHEFSGWEQAKYLRFFGTAMLLGIGEDGHVQTAALHQADAVNRNEAEFSGLSNVKQFSECDTAYVGLKTDGSPFCASWMSESLKNQLAGWGNLQAALINGTSDYIIYGLKEDGTILEAWDNKGNSEPEAMSNLQWVQVVSGKEDSLFASTRKGKILTFGKSNSLLNSEAYQQEMPIQRFIGTWSYLCENGTFKRHKNSGEALQVNGVRQALEFWDGAFGGQSSYAYVFLMNDGTVSVQVKGDWSHPNLKEYKEALDSFAKAAQWTDMIQLASPWRSELYGLTKDGSVLCMQNGTEKAVELTEPIRTLCASPYSHSVLGITEKGRVLPISKEKSDTEKGMLQLESWENISEIAMGESHTVGLRSDGTVAAAGKNYAGQCDVGDWKDIVFLTAGRTCTLGITKDGELRMAGSLY